MSRQNEGTGRSVQYDRLFAHQAYLLCQHHGYTDQRLAEVLDVGLGTLQAWREQHAPFREAIRAGKEQFDKERVEAALLRCATGYVRREVTTKTVHRDGQEYTEVIEVQKEVPADIRAVMFWLCNHDPQQWKPLSQTAREAGLNAEITGAFLVPEPQDPATWLRRAPSQDP